MDIKIERGPTFVLANVAGKLGSDQAEDFTDTLSEHLKGPDTRLAIDLSSVSQITSKGLSALIDLVVRARVGGGQVVLVAPTAFVKGVLQITRLDTWLDIHDTVADAENAFLAAD